MTAEILSFETGRPAEISDGEPSRQDKPMVLAELNESIRRARSDGQLSLAEKLDMMLEISEKIRQEVGIEPVEVADIDVTEDEPVDIEG